MVQNQSLRTAAKALAYAWAAPQMGRHVATIERLSDPTVNAALQAINGGAAALANAEPAVADLLDLAAAAIDDIPQHIIKRYKAEKDQAPAALAAELFQKTDKTAVLTVAVNEHFTGHYPPEWEAEKTCNSGARVTEDDNGVTICKHTAKLWRPRQIDGLYIPACPHCQHTRAWRICQQVEQESDEYRQGQLGLRILEVGKGGRVKFANKARKHQQRTGHDVKYLAMPQSGGGATIIHNMPEWGGQELPGTRPGLFALILGFVAHADLKQNTSSSGGWGGMFKGTQGNSKPATETGQGQPETAVSEEATGAPGEQIKLHVKSWGKLAMLLDATQEHQLRAKDRLGVSIVDFVALLDVAGLEYGIVSGSERLKALQEGVTDSIHTPDTPKDICIKSVTGSTNGRFSQQPLPKFGAKPAPIYLNGEWVE